MKVRYLLTCLLVVISCSCINTKDSNVKPRITSVYNNSVDQTVIGKNIPIENKAHKLNTIAVNKPYDANNKSTFRNILISKIIYFLIGLILGVLIMYLYSSQRIYKILKNEREHYNENINKRDKSYIFNYIQLVDQLKVSKDNKKRDIDRLKNELMTTRNNTNEQSISLDEIVQVNNINSDEKINKIEKPEERGPKEIFWDIAEEEKNKTTEFFFSIPFENGTFLDLHKSETKEHNSFYMIRLIGHNLGELHFLTGEYDKTALDDISGYLTSVCTIENIDKRFSANRIIMKAPGEISLSNGVWKINLNKKVKVELI